MGSSFDVTVESRHTSLLGGPRLFIEQLAAVTWRGHRVTRDANGYVDLDRYVDGPGSYPSNDIDDSILLKVARSAA